MKSILNRIDENVSTLGSMEALLKFSKSPEVNIHVGYTAFGRVLKRCHEDQRYARKENGVGRDLRFWRR